MSLATLKKKSSIEHLTKQIEKLGNKTNSRDDRFWQAEVDKSGNGYAVIRFLDSPFVDGEDGMPWVQMFSHGFQGPGGWYIENCPTTINKECPVCKENTTLWNSGVEANKEVVRKQKRKLTYIANILVVKDQANPDNEGKVFLFKFGKKIFDKIKDKLEPQYEDESPLNPFNFWEGANLKLKIRTVEGYRNYDKSEFDSQSAVADDDDDIEKLWKSSYSLKDFLKPEDFKEYGDLKEKLNRVLGVYGTPTRNVKKTIEEDEDGGDDSPTQAVDTDEDSEDALSFFKKLAQE